MVIAEQTEVLDNPVWNALKGPQAKFTDGNGGFKRYLPAILPFIAIKFESGNKPFLQVSAFNQKAIRLYEFLGFKTRRTIDCWTIRLAD